MNPGARALALTLSLAAPALFSGCGPSQAQGGPPMAPPVSAAPAVSKNIPLYDEFSGRLEAVETVELRSRVAGTLQRVHFRDGQDLKRGELMFSIDARPFAAELTRLEAQLAAARSAEGLSASELVRTKKLLEQKAVSQQEADQAEAGARNASAVVRAAEAAVAAAKLNVEYTQIRAPIAGRASRANVTAGNLVGVGDPVLTTLVAQDKVHAWFDVSEQAFLRARAQMKANATPKVEMALADETGFPHAGAVDFVDHEHLQAQVLHRPPDLRRRAVGPDPAGRPAVAVPAADLRVPGSRAALGRGARPVPGANPKVIAETVAAPLEERSTASRTCSTCSRRPTATAT
jgi:multidrug efflux system membrane fusion protein